MFSTPHFRFHAPNPNLNPSSILLPHSPHLKSSQSNPPQPTDLLPGTLSALDELLQFSQSILNQFASIVPNITTNSPSIDLARCPLNPNHMMPPQHLFHHSLKCPSQLDIGDLVDGLHYPKTLKSEDQLITENKFVQRIDDPGTELWFSLDDYMGFNSNFFYQDCPGVVRLWNGDGRNNRMFSLPGVLAVECENFVGEGYGRMTGVMKDRVRLLPSEVWAVRCEFEQWNDYPCSYSYTVLKLFIGLESVNRFNFLAWMITNSPRFGIVIDVSMRDHIFVLFRLCLKAVMREAFVLRGRLNENGAGISAKEDVNFKCPVMLDALKWLESQLSILYGEGCAKSFTLAMLKNWLIYVASNLMLWHVDQSFSNGYIIKLDSGWLEPNVVASHTSGEVIEDGSHVGADTGICSRPIFVYQIGAAIASLYERSFLEGRIRALRNPRPLAAFERANEHARWSEIAEEERKKRPDYRPLLEHDSLPSQHQHVQGTTGRPKTREELLAEERDYKRRRMSYRGKKLKRTTKEVLRDIIEEHMEAIREAGGIGYSVKGEGKSAILGSASANYSSGAAGSRANTSGVYETRLHQRHGLDKQLLSVYNAKHPERMDSSPDGFHERPKGDSHKHKKGLENHRTMNRDGYDSRYPSRSPDVGGNDGIHREEKSYGHGFSNEQRSIRREHDIDEVADDRHHKSRRDSRYHDCNYRSSKGPSPGIGASDRIRREKRSCSRGLSNEQQSNRRGHYERERDNKYHDSRYHSSSSKSGSVSSKRRDGRGLDSSVRHKQKRDENEGSGSSARNDVMDRYDPSRSQDGDDNELSNSKYVRPVSPYRH